MRAIGKMCVGAAVLALAACGQGNEGGEGATAAGDSSTAASANAGAGAAAGGGTTIEAVTSMMEARKAGKWQMSMGMAGMPQGAPQEICITEEQNQQEQTWDPKQAGAGCPDFRARRDGGAIVMTANCPSDTGAGSMQIESRITGDFQSAYRIETAMRQTPAPQGGPAEIRTFLDMKYLGAC
ncbi:MAG TPA: DUF3617 family protein [Caulobacteraceae bacterium]|jgi:hypothetical protein